MNSLKFYFFYLKISEFFQLEGIVHSVKHVFILFFIIDITFAHYSLHYIIIF